MYKVLIVEDNEENRDMLTRRLARNGCTVFTSSDGRQGILDALLHMPDVILMDLSLPEVDGWTATRELKRNPSTIQIPIIALTAHAMMGDRERALAAGCDEFETKPVELKTLLAKMKALVERRESNGKA